MTSQNPEEMQAPRGGHCVEPLVDGETIYASIHADLQKARRRVYITTWALQDDFVIARCAGEKLTLAEYCKSALAAHPKLEIYILVWDWLGWAQRALRAVGGGNWGRYLLKKLPLPSPEAFTGHLDPALASRLHIALQANDKPDPFGSHHQKMVLVDLEGDVRTMNVGQSPSASLHCVGLNLMNIYWDSQAHPKPGLSEPDSRYARQHDLGVRVCGPVVREFEKEFGRRWLAATGQHLPCDQYACASQGSTSAKALIHKEQTTAGSPAKKWYLERIASAREFIYLENQFFDDPDITKALYTAYLAAEARGVELPMAIVLPWLEKLLPVPDWSPVLKLLPLLERLVPYTPWHPVSWWTHYNIVNLRVRTATRFKVKGHAPYNRPTGGWPAVRPAQNPDRFLRSVYSALPAGAGAPRWAAFLRLLATANHFKVNLGDRWVSWRNIEWIEGGIEVYRMMAQASDWPPVAVYVHSKLGIIDDAYILGSSNIARQSFVTDSEADVAVQGAEEVDRLTRLLWPVLLGCDNPGRLPESRRDALHAFRTAASRNASNAKRHARGRPAHPPAGLLLPWRPLEY